MKKIPLLLLFLCCFAGKAFSQIQQIKIVSFTVKNQLPARIDNWTSTPGALLLVAQKQPNARIEGLKLVVQIRSNGTVICGNNVSTGLPVDNFTTRTFSTQELIGLLGNCNDLKDGSYSICAQFYNIDRVAISNEICKEFSVETPKDIDYAPPTLINPDNGKEYTEAELQRPVIFRWTPLVPKPREPVTYRLRVWQLMQGQNGVAAMRSNTPVIEKDVKEITQATLTNILTGPCKPPYLCDFTWNVQALNKEGKSIGRNNGYSDPWTFKVKPSAEVKGPQHVYPENNKRFNLPDLKGTQTFRWTAVDPVPSAPVIYKLRVWQLMQGQNGAQAMRSNTPIIHKEVTNATELAVSGILTGPCKPPYLCDFIWQVQAVTREGKGIGENEGKSEPTLFMANNCDVSLSLQIKSVECLAPVNGMNKYKICVTATYTSPVYQLTYLNPGSGFTAYHPSYTPTYTVTSVTPALTMQNTGPTSSINYCIEVLVPPAQTTIKIGLQGDDKDPGPIVCQPGAELDVTLPPCRCDACDEKHFTLNAPTPAPINIVNNTIAYNQSITVTTNPVKTVKSIKAELVYFEMTPENDLCIPCNKDAATYGHFANGTNSQQWNGPQQSLPISITTPQMVPCCSATFKWCIRYKIEFTDCTSCNKLVCYEKKKEGCEKGNPVPPQQQN
jgi:hypothetical protein